MNTRIRSFGMSDKGFKFLTIAEVAERLSVSNSDSSPLDNRRHSPGPPLRAPRACLRDRLGRLFGAEP